MMTREEMIASLKKARSHIHPRRNIAEAAACPYLDEVLAALEAEKPLGKPSEYWWYEDEDAIHLYKREEPGCSRMRIQLILEEAAP